MMEVLPYNTNNDNIVREESVPVTTSILPNTDSDYDTHESPEQITTTTNNDWKRNRPEDDDYDF
jgi:hypothetical protein